MKSSWILLLIGGIIACKEPIVSSKQPQSIRYLAQSIELRYSPIDSLIISRSYKPSGQLIAENYSRQSTLALYSVYSIYAPFNNTELVVPTDQYRFYQTDASQQVQAIKQYAAFDLVHWLVTEDDTLIYEQSRLTRQNHRDYSFLADHQRNVTQYPLWLTRRRIAYDPQHRASQQIDSVYITHDMPAGTLIISPTPARYLFTNYTRFAYNDQGDLASQVSSSGADSLPALTYSNGYRVFAGLGPGWSTFSQSWPGKFLSGTTTYRYTYDVDGRLTLQRVEFEDAYTKQYYVSTVHYRYTDS